MIESRICILAFLEPCHRTVIENVTRERLPATKENKIVESRYTVHEDKWSSHFHQRINYRCYTIAGIRVITK